MLVGSVGRSSPAGAIVVSSLEELVVVVCLMDGRWLAEKPLSLPFRVSYRFLRLNRACQLGRTDGINVEGARVV